MIGDYDMNIEMVLVQIGMISFRPIPYNFLKVIRDYILSTLNNDSDGKKKEIYSTIKQLSQKEIIKEALDTFILRNKKNDTFSLACICLRIGEIESQSLLPNVRITDLIWDNYMNLSRDSSVKKYSVNKSFLAVLFYTGVDAYVYSYKKTGVLGTEYMKACATRGDGLGRCTASYFKDHNGFSKIR